MPGFDSDSYKEHAAHFLTFCPEDCAAYVHGKNKNVYHLLCWMLEFLVKFLVYSGQNVKVVASLCTD